MEEIINRLHISSSKAVANFSLFTYHFSLILYGQHREVIALFSTIDKIVNGLIHLVCDVDGLVLTLCQEALGNFRNAFVAKLFVNGILGTILREHEAQA